MEDPCIAMFFLYVSMRGRRTIYGLLKDFVSLLLNGTELILHGENGLTRLGLKLVPN